ncbi:MAG: hypothetical protein LBE13_19985 [Bacteroidales bacterium]|jgi:hypothetical protein|nr:hypothetical protein [Bacteroidales bacterium]
MFDKEYSFRGSHAAKVKKLTEAFDGKNSIFKTNYDVYVVAPIIGFSYKKKVPRDRDTASKTDIFIEKLIKERDNLMFSYRLIMLADVDYEPDLQKRIDKAFKYYNTAQAKEDEELYDSYVRGGVDLLYEYIVGKSHTSEDYIENIYNFMHDFQRRLEDIDLEKIMDLCKNQT